MRAKIRIKAASLLDKTGRIEPPGELVGLTVRPESRSRNASNVRTRSGVRTILILMLTFGFPHCLSVMRAADAPILEVTQSTYSGLYPGDQFTISLNVDNPLSSPIVAYDISVSATAAEVFTIVAQILEAPVDQSNAPSLPFSVMTDNNNDFGAFNFATTAGFDMGVSSAQTLAISISPFAVPGDYILSFGWSFFSADGGPFLVDAEINQYQMSEPLLVTVSIVPESTSAFLLIPALGLLLCMRQKRGARVG